MLEYKELKNFKSDTKKIILKQGINFDGYLVCFKNRDIDIKIPFHNYSTALKQYNNYCN